MVCSAFDADSRLRAPGSAGFDRQARAGVVHRDRVLGCLLGGAVGDALGAPVEFSSLAQLRARFGEQGITEFSPAYGRLGAITDDTQLTLFVVDGLLAAYAHGVSEVAAIASYIHDGMLRWLFTQGEHNAELGPPRREGLLERAELFSRRAPGSTCLNALRGCSELGELASNDSKGCGAVMRIAPIGLVETLDVVGPLANLSARHTHGHPESTHSSEFFALTVAYLTAGAGLREAFERAKSGLEHVAAAGPTLQLVQRAIALADSSQPNVPEVVEQLGAGWVAEEAVAVSVFCALRAESFEHGVRLAVNHGGDSDSTGSLTGQLLGVHWGLDAVPRRWLEALEARDLIVDLGTQLAALEPRAPNPDEER